MTTTVYITDPVAKKELLPNRYIIEAVRIMLLLNQDKLVISEFSERNAKRHRHARTVMLVDGVQLGGRRMPDGTWEIYRKAGVNW